MTEALCKSRASSWEQIPLLEPSTRRWCPTPRRWTCPTLSQQQPSGCVTWGMNACLHGDKEGILQLLLDKVAKECRPEDKTGKFCDKCHRHRAIRAMEPLRKPSPQCVDLLEHLWHFSIQITTLERQSSRLCAHFSRSLQFTEIQLLLVIVTVHFINHRCQVNQNQCMWTEAQLDSSKVWLCKKAFRGLMISPQAWCDHNTQKINDMNYKQLISDPSTYVKKRAQRSDASILLRHMDDVVCTGPDEHLMSDFEHMKASLYLTDVVVVRHEGDTVNFLRLEITKTSRGFEVKNSTDLVESLLNLYGWENSKPTANPGRRSIVMGLASATPQGGHEHSNFRTAVGKLTHLHGTLETRHAVRHPTTIHTSPQSHNREQARSETVDTISQRHATHLSSS